MTCFIKESGTTSAPVYTFKSQPGISGIVLGFEMHNRIKNNMNQ